VWLITSSVVLGWGLGANDAANVFGAAVSSQVLRWGTAAVLTAAFVTIGAVAQGAGGVHTVGSVVEQTSVQAVISMFAAGLSVLVLTTLKLPVSTSQAVIGGLVSVGLITGADVNGQVLVKVVTCWVGTPIGAAVFAVIFYYLLAMVFARFEMTLFTYDTLVRRGLVVLGIYAAYSLGANNVGNVSGVLYQAESFDLSVTLACLIGGAFIAFGVLTYSKNVMRTVGRGLVPLDGFCALVVMLSSAATIHVYAMVGVPVSSSQAVVGAVIGIAFVKGLALLNRGMVVRVLFGWIATPLVAGAIAAAIYGLRAISPML